MKEALAKDFPRKQKLIEIAPEMILELLRVPVGGIQVGSEVIRSVGDEIPASARVLRAGISEQGDVLLVVEDESFDALGKECRIPRMNLKWSAEKIRRGPVGAAGVCDLCRSTDRVVTAWDGVQECVACRGEGK